MKCFGLSNKLLFIIIMLVAFLSLSPLFYAENLEIDTTNALEIPHAQKINKNISSSISGWIKKGNYQYYYKNGKKLRDTITRIGKYTFAFDKKGRSIRSKAIRKPYGSYMSKCYLFNKKGHLSFYDVESKSSAEIYRYKPDSKGDDYMYAYMDVLLEENYSPVKNRNECCWLSSSIKLPKQRYTFSLTKYSDCSRKGKLFPITKLKKGMKLRIFWKGYVNDCDPMDIPYILKVKVLS